MTCFWNALERSLKNDDYLFIEEKRPCNIQQLIKLLQKKNKPTYNVLWQSQSLSNKEIEENLDAINTYNIFGIYGGHLTSGSDPFLLLICELFCVEIHYKCVGTLIKYTNIKKSRKTLCFSSSKSHFS